MDTPVKRELNQYERMRLANAKKAQAKFQEIADGMGMFWTLEPPADEPLAMRGHLVGSDGHKLFIRWNDYKDQIYVSGCYPLDRKGSQFSPRDGLSVSMAFRRNGASIATGIRRRLLPAYQEAYQEALVRQKDEQEWLARRSREYKVIAAALGKSGGLPDVQLDSWSIRLNMSHHDVGLYGEVVISGHRGVTVNVRGIPAETAGKMLRVLMEHMESMPKEE